LSLVLFDIDGTLLLSGGAGVRAMTRAFESVFAVADAFTGMTIAGRTDTHLVSAALDRAGLPDTPAHHARFRDAYLPVLAEEILQPGRGTRAVMPGVEPLLSVLAADPAFHVALLTGNYEHAAYVKLDHFGLKRFFAWGVFGDESADRRELGRIAMARAAEQAVPPSARARAVVIGDTPDDIDCARAAGARAIAVATGSYGIDALEAAAADFVLSDLSDTDAILEILRR
jgi:phosphoglycolate phosphatase